MAIVHLFASCGHHVLGLGLDITCALESTASDFPGWVFLMSIRFDAA